MRARFLTVGLLALAACAAQSASGTGGSATLAPLRSCETRVFSLRGAQVVIQTNADAKPGSITVTGADEQTRAGVRSEAVRAFGTPAPDDRTFQKQWKLGLVQIVDACGRVISPGRATTTPH